MKIVTFFNNKGGVGRFVGEADSVSESKIAFIIGGTVS